MRAGSRRGSAGVGGGNADTHTIPGAERMMRQDSGIRLRRSVVRGDHPAMHLDLGARRDDTGNREAAQVVAEGETTIRSPDEFGLVEGTQRRHGNA